MTIATTNVKSFMKYVYGIYPQLPTKNHHPLKGVKRMYESSY